MNEVMERRLVEGMQVVFVDAERKAYFVGEDPNKPGTYVGYVQPADGSQAPRRLYCAYMDREGYTSLQQALEQVGLYLSNKRNQCMRYETYVNGKLVTLEEYNAIAWGRLEPPSAQDPVRLVSLQDIEYRIAHHMRGAYNQMLEVGRCLVEAKESGLVPHGEWEAWVRRNTGLTERRAQKLMQAAREVHVGSAMERLSMSKIQALLALPEERREAIAQAADAEELSLREIERRIEDVRREEREKARIDLEALKDGYGHTMEELRVKLQNAEAAAQGGNSDQAKAEIDRLKGQLKAAQEAAAKIGDELRRSSAVKEQEMRALLDKAQRDAEAAEEYAKRQAQLREQAQRELLESKTREARGEAARAPRLGPDELAAAVRAFVGAAGVLPHMGNELAGASNTERRVFRQYVDMVAQWVDGARAALSAECVSGWLED